MKKALVISTAALAMMMGSACSVWEGQVGKTTDAFTDDHGRVCTAVKWGESASLDCDWPVNND